MMGAQSATTTAAFALGVLVLAPAGGGGGPAASRGSAGAGGKERGAGKRVGMVDAFLGHSAIITPSRGGPDARICASRTGYLAVPPGSSNDGATMLPSAAMTMALKSSPPPTSSSNGGGGRASGSGGGVKRRASRTSGFGHSNEDFRYVAAIKGGVAGFLEAMDQSLSGDLVVVVTYLPWCRSCHHLRHRLRVLAEAHALAGSGAMFYEIDLHANPEVHKMLDIHAAPTVLLYCAGQLVDEFTCAGDSGPRVMLKHIEEQVGSIPDPWHRIPDTGPPPESPTPGVWKEGGDGVV